MIREEPSRALLLVGLAGLAVVTPFWLHENTGDVGIGESIIGGALLPLALMYMVTHKKRNWSGITALVMIVYSVVGVMDIVATLADLGTGMAMALLGVANFFLALDAGRRKPN